MNLWTHVVDSADERLRVFIQVRGKDEIGDLQIEVVTRIDVQILWFKVPMSETFVLNSLKPIDQLFEVVASNWLRQTTCLGENNEQVGLVGREDEVGIRIAPEFNHASVETFDDVGVVDHVEDLLLIFGFIYLRLLFLVQFDEDFDSLHLTFWLILHGQILTLWFILGLT